MEEQAQLPQKELCKAMAVVFQKIKSVVKDKPVQTGSYKYFYADIANVVEAIKTATEGTGIFFMQKIHQVPGVAAVETIIFHESGESMSCGITMVPPKDSTPQGYGGALTYSRRYSLSAAFAIAPEDDDGHGVCEEKPKDKKAPPAVKAAPPAAIKRSLCNQAQLLELAKKAIQGLELDDSELDDMVAFLASTQEKLIEGSIQESVTKNLCDRERYLDFFGKFKKRKLIPVDGNA